MAGTGGNQREPVGLPNPWTVSLLTITIAGELLGMSQSAAYRAAAEGELPTITLSGGRRVPTAELYRLLGLPIPPRPARPAVANG